MTGPNYETRRNRLLRKLKEASVDSLLVTGPSNVRYLTGFSGSSGWLFLSSSTTVILSDTRYETQLADECPGLDAEIRDAASTLDDHAARVIAKARVKRVGIEADYVTLSQHSSLAKKIVSAEIVATSGLVERLREVKDKWEIEQTREAVRIAERGFAVVLSSLRPNQTETEIRFLLEASMRTFGSTGPAFEPIVGVGPTSALPHAHADWGAEVKSHYRSDLTRVLITGKPTRLMEQVYNTVLKAQQAAIQAIRPGVRCADVDKIARRIIADAGFGKNFGHGLGHGFGLEIHESVRMSPLSEQVFEVGMLVTVEPGIYLPGKFGVRIEDDLLLVPDGNEVLSNVPREFEEAIVPFLA